MHVESRIDSVTVYRRGALVTRAVQLNGESDSLRLDNLPLALDDASLRVRVEGGGEAVDARVELLVGGDEPELEPAWNEELLAAAQDKKRCKVRYRDLESELSLLDELSLAERPRLENEPPGESPTAARIALLRFTEERAKTLLEQLEAAREAHRLAAEEHARLKEAHRRASNARQARSRELRKTVRVQLDGPAEGRLFVSYAVPGATWAPSYTLRLTPGLDQAELSVRALVRQRSREDWSDTRIVLSTADLQGWTELPELQSLRIGRAQSRKTATWRPPPTGSGALYTDHDRAFGPPTADRYAAPARPTRRPSRPPAPVAEREEEPAGWDDDLDEGFLEEAFDMADAPDTNTELAPVAASQAPRPPPMALMAAPSRSAPRAKKARFGGRASGGTMQFQSAPSAAAGGAFSNPIAPPEPPPPTTVADEDLRDFNRLRMPAPDDTRRGRLVLASRQTLAVELLRVEAVSELFVVLERASSQAASHRAPPPGHHLAERFEGFDFAWSAEHAVDVPADGAWHSIPLQGATGGARPRYVCVPRESQDVFRTVELNNPLDAPLLAGPVDVWVGGAYLLTAQLGPCPAGGELTLGLGVEQGIKVARNARFEEASAGLLNNQRELKHEVRVELANRLDRAVAIEVRERLPTVPEEEDDIDLIVGDVEPPWQEWEPKDRPLEGGYRWRLDVDAASERTVVAHYSIRIPGKHELVGGNRRES